MGINQLKKLSENKNFYNLIRGDCLQVLPTLEDESIDLVVTSPPFNLGNTHHTGNHRFSPYNDDLPEEEYQEKQLMILNELHRVTKNDGSLFYQHKNRIKDGVSITPYLWLLKSKWIIKQEIVWFNRSQNFDKCRFYPMTERIYWLAKGSETKLFNSINKHDLWEIQPVGTKQSFTRAYPEELVSNIIKCFEKANVVLDPFLGSGTTMKACQTLNRNCIGIEINSDYCDIVKKRCFGTKPLDREVDYIYEEMP